MTPSSLTLLLTILFVNIGDAQRGPISVGFGTSEPLGSGWCTGSVRHGRPFVVGTSGYVG